MKFNFENVNVYCEFIHQVKSVQVIAQVQMVFMGFADFFINLLFPVLELVCYQ